MIEILKRSLTLKNYKKKPKTLIRLLTLELHTKSCSILKSLDKLVLKIGKWKGNLETLFFRSLWFRHNIFTKFFYVKVFFLCKENPQLPKNFCMICSYWLETYWVFFNNKMTTHGLSKHFFFSNQNSDKSEVSINSSSIKSTNFEWKAIVFIVLASDVCLSSENGNFPTLVYVWNLNQSSLSGRKLIGSLFSICFILRVDIVLLKELSKMASSSGNVFNCSMCWFKRLASFPFKYSM